VIQAYSLLGSAHASITSSNAVSTRISNREHDRRSDRLTRSPSTGRMARGSGDHHRMGPSPGDIGNRPLR
jgi:hypothetical protein